MSTDGTLLVTPVSASVEDDVVVPLYLACACWISSCIWDVSDDVLEESLLR